MFVAVAIAAATLLVLTVLTILIASLVMKHEDTRLQYGKPPTTLARFTRRLMGLYVNTPGRGPGRTPAPSDRGSRTTRRKEVRHP
ncbi:hypothetical protein GCM10010412_095540 [Nonomuraea recticatena]|uniref:Secreted protein n=1 Tax=Nonomuraea recticatena TaxID=46178 RepID=A0ABN3TC20_9ACTN